MIPRALRTLYPVRPAKDAERSQAAGVRGLDAVTPAASFADGGAPNPSPSATAGGAHRPPSAVDHRVSERLAVAADLWRQLAKRLGVEL